MICGAQDFLAASRLCAPSREVAEDVEWQFLPHPVFERWADMIEKLWDARFILSDFELLKPKERAHLMLQREVK